MKKTIILSLILVMLLMVSCSKNEEYAPQSDYEPQAEELSEMPEAPADPVVTENQTQTTQNEPTSVISYDFNESLKSELDMGAFDKALVKFLHEKNMMPQDRDGNDVGVTVKDTGWITKSLTDDSITFDITIDDITISCAGSHGEYAFDIN